MIVYQLPIYDEPEPARFEHVPEWETAFHRQVSRARRWTWSYLDSIQVQITDIGRELCTYTCVPTSKILVH